MKLQLQAIITLLALVNPAMCAALFLQVADTESRRTQLIGATRAALTVLFILVLDALIGARAFLGG
jgi:small neutral amino acid transporter SnatA (MarC family)